MTYLDLIATALASLATLLWLLGRYEIDARPP